MGEGIRIRMLRDVRPDTIGGIHLGNPGTISRAGKIYEAYSNENGAISAVCENSVLLGVKPGEFEFVEAPEWVLRSWINYPISGAENLLKKVWGQSFEPIAMKPIRNCEKRFNCPRCSEIHTYRMSYMLRMDYCFKCGQWLDWSDYDEWITKY